VLVRRGLRDRLDRADLGETGAELRVSAVEVNLFGFRRRGRGPGGVGVDLGRCRRVGRWGCVGCSWVGGTGGVCGDGGR
jgi:hypothetical protein